MSKSNDDLYVIGKTLNLDTNCSGMKNQPKLNLKETRANLLLEVLGWASIVVLWAITIFFYSGLPDKIPTHYNLSGEPDSFGTKKTIIALPIIATVLFLFISMLNKYPHIFNYPVKITEKNALAQYQNTLMMTRYLKLGITILFTLIVIETIRFTNLESKQPTPYLWLLALVIFFIPIGYFVMRAFKLR